MMSFAPISYIADFSFSVRFRKLSNSAIVRFRRSVSSSICSSFLSFFLEKNPFFSFSPSGACASSEEASFSFTASASAWVSVSFTCSSFAASAALESISVFAMSLTSLFCTSVLLGIFMIECLIELAL